MKCQEPPVRILIDHAEMGIPRIGHQVTGNVPEMEARFQRFPSYADPRSAEEADNMMRLSIAWINETGIRMETDFFFELSKAKALRRFACGPVVEHSESEYPSHQFTYPVSASFALDLLKARGHAPAISSCANDNDLPFEYESELAA